MRIKFNWKILVLIAFELSLAILVFRKTWYLIREIKFEGNGLVLRLELVSRHENKFQLYYSMSPVFDEKQTISRELSGAPGRQLLDFHLPLGIQADHFRIDMGMLADTIGIYGMQLISPNNTYEWSAQKFKNDFIPASQISGYEVKQNMLEVITTGKDPFTVNKYSLYYLFDSFGHDSVNSTRITLYAFIITLVFFGIMHFILFARFQPKEEE